MHDGVNVRLILQDNFFIQVYYLILMRVKNTTTAVVVVVPEAMLKGLWLGAGFPSSTVGLPKPLQIHGERYIKVNTRA